MILSKISIFSDQETKESDESSSSDTEEEEIDVVDKPDSHNVPSKCKIDKYLEDIKKPQKTVEKKSSPKSFQAAFESLVAAKGNSFYLPSQKKEINLKNPKKRKSEEDLKIDSSLDQHLDPEMSASTSMMSPPKKNRHDSGEGKKKNRQSYTPTSGSYSFMPLSQQAGSSTTSSKELDDFNRLNFLMPTIRWIKQQKMLQNCGSKPGISPLQMPSPFVQTSSEHLSFSDLSKAQNEVVVYPHGLMIPKQSHSKTQTISVSPKSPKARTPLSPKALSPRSQPSLSPKSYPGLSPKVLEHYSKLGLQSLGSTISSEHQYCNRYSTDQKPQALDLSVSTATPPKGDGVVKNSPLFRSLLTGATPSVSSAYTVATATIKQESSTASTTCTTSSVQNDNSMTSTASNFEMSDVNFNVGSISSSGLSASTSSDVPKSEKVTSEKSSIETSSTVVKPPMKLTGSQQDLFSNMNQAFELVTSVLNQKTDEIDQAESNRKLSEEQSTRSGNATGTSISGPRSSLDQNKLPAQLKIVHQQPRLLTKTILSPVSKSSEGSLLSPTSQTLASPPRLAYQGNNTTTILGQTAGRQNAMMGGATMVSPRSQHAASSQRPAFSNVGRVVQNPIQLGTNSAFLPGQNIMLQQNTSQPQTFLVSIPVMTTSGTGAPSMPTTIISSTRASQVSSMTGSVNKGVSESKTLVVQSSAQQIQQNNKSSMTVNQLLKASREKAAAVKISAAPVNGNANTIVVSTGNPIMIGTKVVQVQPTICLNSQLQTTTQTKTVSVVNVMPTPSQRNVSYILTPSNNSSQANQVINIGTNQLVSQTSATTTTPAVQKSIASKPAISVMNVRNIVNQTTVKPGSLVNKPVPQFGGSPQFGTTQFLLQGVTQIHPMPAKHFQVDSKTPLFQSIVSKTPSQALSLAKSVNSASNLNSNQPPVSVISSQNVTSAVSSRKGLDALDNDQAYGAIVSPNKVLQLVPQPIVPISQASKVTKSSAESVKPKTIVSSSSNSNSVDSTSSKDLKKEKPSPKKQSLYKGGPNGELLQTLVQTSSYSSFSGTGSKHKGKKVDTSEASSSEETPKKVCT